MNITPDYKTQKEVDRLFDLLDLEPDADLRTLLAAAVDRIKDYDAVTYERDEETGRADREEERADRAERFLEEARPYIHAQHGGQPPLADLSLCVHPDCTRFHS